MHNKDNNAEIVTIYIVQQVVNVINLLEQFVKYTAGASIIGLFSGEK